MIWQKNVENVITCDVAVVGGGTAGICAAVCAAKCGAEVVLVEKSSVLGGTVTNAGVDFPGIFHAWGRQIIAGPCWDAILKMQALGGAEIPEIVRKPEAHWMMQIRVNPFVFASVWEQTCVEAGVKILYHTTLADARETDGGAELLCVGKEGMHVLAARRVIDCTGDANAVQMLGYAVEGNARPQPATLIHDLDGYRPEDVDQEDLESKYKKALASGELTEADFQGYGPWTSLVRRRVYMHVPVTDETSSEARTDLEIRARRLLMKTVAFLRTVKGAEGLYVKNCAWECGVRESVTVVGETKMTVDNYVSGYLYPDAVCYAFYPVDRHTPEGIYQIFLDEDVVPTVPLSALLPKGSRFLAVAGRCISADKDTLSAVRVQAPCMAEGQAVGVACALSVKQNCAVGDVDFEELKRMLRSMNAIVPEKLK